MLTPDQLRFFNAFGYVVLKKFFSEQELRTVHDEFERAMAANYPGRKFDGSHRHYAALMDYQKAPFFAALLDGPRFYPMAQQMYGEKTLGVCVDANRYVGNSGWHRDTGTSVNGVTGVKFAMYLQPVGPETGALRVIPGSHRIPVNDAVFDAGVYKLPITEVPATALCSEPGDVVAFDLRLWHGSWGGQADRRMCTVVYYKDPENAEEVASVVKTAEFNAAVGKRDFHSTQSYFYSASWVKNAERNPHRQRWIDRFSEMGYFKAPGLVEAER